MDKQMNEKLEYTFIVAGVVIEKDDKFLLVQEKKANVYGKWNLPAGKVDKGYSIEETAIKEAKEETGYDVELIEKLVTDQKTVNEPVKHSFLAKIIGGELKFPEDEILDAKWFALEEIKEKESEMRVPFVLESIKLAFNRRLNENN